MAHGRLAARVVHSEMKGSVFLNAVKEGSEVACPKRAETSSGAFDERFSGRRSVSREIAGN
ncbi:hypothetical protein ACFFQF_13515 [Haladaptatus pallidirubidus]|uniref:hypothetical protein n=1 Tax=Haladaptatus pallidirubidus TaxID=1008152 RepID=UPI0035E8751D